MRAITAVKTDFEGKASALPFSFDSLRRQV